MSEILHGSATRTNDVRTHDSWGEDRSVSGVAPIANPQNARNFGTLSHLAGDRRTTVPPSLQRSSTRLSLTASRESPYQQLPPRVGQTLEQSEGHYANGDPIWRLVVADESDCHFKHNGIPVKRVFGKGTTDESTAPVRRDGAVPENERIGPREGIPIQIHYARPVNGHGETGEPAEEIPRDEGRVQNPRGANPVPTHPPRDVPVDVPSDQANRAQQGASNPPAPVQNAVRVAPPEAALFAQLPVEVQQGVHQVLTNAGFHSGTPGVTNPLDDRFWVGYSQPRLEAAHGLLARTVQGLTANAYGGQLQSNGNLMDGLSALGGAFSQRTALNNFQLQMIEALNAIMNKVGHLIAEAAKAH